MPKYPRWTRVALVIATFAIVAPPSFIAKPSGAIRVIATSQTPEGQRALGEVKPASEDENPIADLIHGLMDPDRLDRSVDQLTRMLDAPGDGGRLPFVPYEKDLIHVLESSKNKRATTIASLILFRIDSPDAKAATATRYRRDQAFREQAVRDREARATTLQTEDQIKAPIRPSDYPAEEFQIVFFENVLPGDDGMVVSRHRNENEDELLEVWRKEGGNYRMLRSVSTEGGIAFIESSRRFEFGKETFFLVYVRYPGTGYFHSSNVYHVDRTAHSLDDVDLREASKEFPLPPDDEVLKGEFVDFSDNNISVEFYIWKRDTCNACAYDMVTGNYTIERDDKGTWVMKPVGLKRKGGL